MTPTDIDLRIKEIAGKALRGESYDNNELQHLISKRTEDLVKLPSVRGIAAKWEKERRDALIERYGLKR